MDGFATGAFAGFVGGSASGIVDGFGLVVFGCLEFWHYIPDLDLSDSIVDEDII